MSMQKTGRIQLRRVIAYAGDGAKNVTFVNVGDVSYNVATGKSEVTRAEHVVRCLVYRVKDEEKRAGVTAHCLKITLTPDMIPFSPDSEDEVLIDGETWLVSNVIVDAVGVQMVVEVCRE